MVCEALRSRRCTVLILRLTAGIPDIINKDTRWKDFKESNPDYEDILRRYAKENAAGGAVGASHRRTVRHKEKKANTSGNAEHDWKLAGDLSIPIDKQEQALKSALDEILQLVCPLELPHRFDNDLWCWQIHHKGHLFGIDGFVYLALKTPQAHAAHAVVGVGSELVTKYFAESGHALKLECIDLQRFLQ